MAGSSQITMMLKRISQGDKRAFDEMFPLVHAELKRRAELCMEAESTGHTLQATALVNEAYLKLADQLLDCQSRAHFYNTAAQAMRRILVDYARAARTAKRGGGALRITIANVDPTFNPPTLDLLALDVAIEELERRWPRQAQVILLRFFGGLSEQEVAKMLEVDPKTVRRDWATARIWLFRQMKGTDG